eukprot:RCo052268
MQEWLQERELEGLYEVLLENDFTSLSALAQLEEDDLVAMNIRKVGTRRKLLNAVQGLRIQAVDSARALPALGGGRSARNSKARVSLDSSGAPGGRAGLPSPGGGDPAKTAAGSAAAVVPVQLPLPAPSFDPEDSARVIRSLSARISKLGSRAENLAADPFAAGTGVVKRPSVTWVATSEAARSSA